MALSAHLRLTTEHLKFRQDCLRCDQLKTELNAALMIHPNVVVDDKYWQHIYDSHYRDFSLLHESEVINANPDSATEAHVQRRCDYVSDANNKCVLLWDVCLIREASAVSDYQRDHIKPFSCW